MFEESSCLDSASPGIYSGRTFLNGLFLSEPDPPIMSALRPASMPVDVLDATSFRPALGEDGGKRICAAAHRFEVNGVLKIWWEAFPDRARERPRFRMLSGVT
ncbi:hypothetical protein K438DRAFT_1758494 [Mycena galopus ATCC 62051]|nr:hypothetical protein K438DRAFT_1758494 [Mycena galopus ATCC 62051]